MVLRHPYIDPPIVKYAQNGAPTFHPNEVAELKLVFLGSAGV